MQQVVNYIKEFLTIRDTDSVTATEISKKFIPLLYETEQGDMFTRSCIRLLHTKGWYSGLSNREEWIALLNKFFGPDVKSTMTSQEYMDLSKAIIKQYFDIDVINPVTFTPVKAPAKKTTRKKKAETNE